MAGQTLASYGYGPMNGKPTGTSYGTGFSVVYEYNEKEQQTKEKWTEQGAPEITASEIVYDNSGKRVN